MKYFREPWRHQHLCIAKAEVHRDYGLFFEQGCLARDSEIKVNVGGCSRTHTIEELYRLWNRVELNAKEVGISRSARVRSWKGEEVSLNGIVGVYRSGEKEVYALKIRGKPRIKLTHDHKILTRRGWVAAGELTSSDWVACDDTTKHQKKTSPSKRKKPTYLTIKVGEYHPFAPLVAGYKGKRFHRIEKHRAIFEANLNGISLSEYQKITSSKNNLEFVDPSIYHIHHKDHNSHNNDIDNLEKLLASDHLSLHSKGYSNFGHGLLSWRRVEKFSYVGVEMTYDIECQAPYHNFIANGIVVHNSGKSLTAINIARKQYYKYGRLLRTLVVCPPIVRSNWVREWAANSNLSKKVLMLDGRGDVRARKVKELKGEPAIIITNYESFRNGDLHHNLMLWEPELIIFDESHKCKTHNSKMTQHCYKLAQKAKHRYILTGTPMLNSPSDLFSQFKIMDLGETFGTSFFSFRDKYFIDMNRLKKNVDFPDWRPKPNLEGEINKKIGQRSMRVMKSECLDLPPLVTQRVDIPLSKEQQKVYDDLKRDFVAYLGDSACVATLALTKALRLLQISTGFISLEDENGEKTERIFKKNPRDEALASILEEIVPHEKVIIWAVFKRNYDSIRAVCKKLGFELVEVHGDISDRKKQENVDAFSDPKGPRVLLGHPASAGIGINLVSASFSVRYSRSFNLGDYLQSQARNYRAGSEIHEKITEIDLVSPGTLDEQVMAALRSKQDLASKILDIKELV